MSKQTGFTLMEVLVSLVIIAVAMTALMMSLTELTHRQQLLKQKELALIVANNVLIQIEFGLFPLSKISGSDTQLGHEFTWKSSHYATDNPAIQRIVVDVSEGERQIQSLEGFKKVKRP